MPGAIGEHARPAPGVVVVHEALDAGPDRYADKFSGSAEAVGAAALRAERVGSGDWLVEAVGPAPWWERTTVALQLRETAGAWSVVSAHLRWSADYAPVVAWAALERGRIVLDQFAADAGLLRVEFELHGQIVPDAETGPSRSKAAAEPWRVWASGAFSVPLHAETCPPVSAGLKEKLARVAESR